MLCVRLFIYFFLFFSFLFVVKCLYMLSCIDDSCCASFSYSSVATLPLLESVASPSPVLSLRTQFLFALLQRLLFYCVNACIFAVFICSLCCGISVSIKLQSSNVLESKETILLRIRFYFSLRCNRWDVYALFGQHFSIPMTIPKVVAE